MNKFLLIASMIGIISTAQVAMASDIIIENPTIRMAKKGMSTGGFMTIKNTGSQADVLLSAQSNIAKRTEVHLSSISKDGMAKMEHQKDGIKIPAGGSLVLKHGSYHIMFMKLTQNVKHHHVSFKLVFKNAGTVMIHAKVVSHTMKKHNKTHTHN